MQLEEGAGLGGAGGARDGGQAERAGEVGGELGVGAERDRRDARGRGLPRLHAGGADDEDGGERGEGEAEHEQRAQDAAAPPPRGGTAAGRSFTARLGLGHAPG